MAIFGETCRKCGCTDNKACVHPKLGPCFWVEGDLCSHCVIKWEKWRAACLGWIGGGATRCIQHETGEKERGSREYRRQAACVLAQAVEAERREPGHHERRCRLPARGAGRTARPAGSGRRDARSVRAPA